jgi:hypothetical protein
VGGFFFFKADEVCEMQGRAGSCTGEEDGGRKGELEKKEKKRAEKRKGEWGAGPEQGRRKENRAGRRERKDEEREGRGKWF